ncbi:ras GTPase-activating protein family - IQGAP [Moesziomyces antarcticus T-34]|uniref:Ras GTPase-activating protein family-IQGAP n=1 Tax=Pseudozyma antarctica (strain T-34) TaxID=1151754 RepID=M9MD24_PSEA3|nr:ras GTPase-activating protein family - IQGAP [Moesziomyces antarcticus T-34]
MSASPFDLRMPRLEGHLILNTATLSDSPQTSDRTAWSEKWCSLEDGCLLVYHDRTAAIVMPDEPICTIDLRSFAHVQPAPPHTDALCNLVISCTPLEPPKSSRLFRPKSAMSLNRLQSDSVPRDPLDQEPRPSLASSSGRVSFQALKSGAHTPVAMSTNFEPRTRTSSSHSNSWAKLRSGSRKLYAKVSSSSSASFRTDSPAALASSASSVASIADLSDLTDMTSSGAPSPRTPILSNFGQGLERVYLRTMSEEDLDSWLEALSRSIRLLQEADGVPVHLLLPKKRVSSRPSLGNLPGFRTPASLSDSPLLPSMEQGAVSTIDDTTPKPTRKRVASSSSLGLALASSRALQQAASGRPKDVHTASTLPSWTAESTGAGNALPMGPPDTMQLRSNLKHKRSISTTSSSLSLSGSSPFVSTRRNSISSTRLLSSSVSVTRPATACAYTAFFAQPMREGSGEATTSRLTEPSSAATMVAETTANTRHRRSGSILRSGSARIMAWRDKSSTSEAPATQARPVGLGLEMGGHDSAEARRHEPSRGLNKLKSFRLLPKGTSSVQETGRMSASASEYGSFQDRGAGHPDSAHETSAKKSRGMARTSSLLSLTRHTFSSLRPRARPSVKQTFALMNADESVHEVQVDASMRVEPAEGDFSYELIAPAQADCTAASTSPALQSHDAVVSSSRTTSRAGARPLLAREACVTAPAELASDYSEISLNRMDGDTSECLATPPLPGGRAEASPVARAESLEEVQDENVQSLPAPPRASKRRALVSTGAAASPRPRPAPLGDRTNALQVAGLPDVGELCIDDRRPAARGRRAQGAVTA